LVIIFYFFRRNALYKKRFIALMEEYDQKKIQKEKEKSAPKVVVVSQKTTPRITTEKETIGLPQDIVDGILVKLKKFEDTHRFAKKNYTLTKLAKELDTNSTYLSKIINMTKGMNFAKYMNEIRIDYAITRLKEDKRFRCTVIFDRFSQKNGHKPILLLKTA